MPSALLEEVRTVMVPPPTRKPTDRQLAKQKEAAAREAQRARMAEAREERFLARKADLDANPHISQARRDALLDRTIITIGQIAEMLGVSQNRASVLNGARKATLKPQDHPSRLPDADTIEGYQGPSYGWEIGRVTEWLLIRSHVLDDENGALLRQPPSHGAPAKPNVRTDYKGDGRNRRKKTE